MITDAEIDELSETQVKEILKLINRDFDISYEYFEVTT